MPIATEPNEATRRLALATYLEEDVEDLSRFDYDDEDSSFRSATKEYLVLTDEEADHMAKARIEEGVWAFNPSFLVGHMQLPSAAEKMLEAFQRAESEGANDTFLEMIEDFDAFAEDAISSDGRGNFLAGYDGDEAEVTVEGTTFYIYRNN